MRRTTTPHWRAQSFRTQSKGSTPHWLTLIKPHCMKIGDFAEIWPFELGDSAEWGITYSIPIRKIKSHSPFATKPPHRFAVRGLFLTL